MKVVEQFQGSSISISTTGIYMSMYSYNNTTRDTESGFYPASWRSMAFHGSVMTFHGTVMAQTLTPMGTPWLEQVPWHRGGDGTVLWYPRDISCSFTTFDGRSCPLTNCHGFICFHGNAMAVPWPITAIWRMTIRLLYTISLSHSP